MKNDALKKYLDESGFIKLREGVWAHTQANIIAEQKEWDDEDESKEDDFSTSDYWIVTDSGEEADPVTLSEIAQILLENT